MLDLIEEKMSGLNKNTTFLFSFQTEKRENGKEF
jgi:hypothetical protein